MPNIGNIAVPEISVSLTFPLVSDYPYGRAHRPHIVEHRMGANSANAKVSQRYYLGSGAKEFTVKREVLTIQQRRDLVQFWHDLRGQYGSFIYDAPNEDGNGTTAFTCRLKDPSLTFEFMVSAICSTGLEFVEIPTTNPSYTIGEEATRITRLIEQEDGTTREQLLPTGFENSLLSQVQEIIPLIRIATKDESYAVIYLSDRRCVIGEQYEPRLLDFGGIEQSMDGASDQASFTFGNADRVMTKLVNEVDLFRADLQFSLYHVNSQVKLNLWRGNMTDWKAGAGSEVFTLAASDGFYELTQLYPKRKISRTCLKRYNDAADGCDWEDRTNEEVATKRTWLWKKPQQWTTSDPVDAKDKLFVFQPDPTKCDKSFDGPNGCLAHKMEDRFGGILAYPQSVRISWSGEDPITHTSLIADSIYGQAIPEIYCDIQHADKAIGLPVKAKISAGRDEGDFYAAIGIVAEGPIVEFAAPRPYPIVMENGAIVWPENTAALSKQQALDAFYRLFNKDVPEQQATIEKQMGRRLKPTEVISLAFNPHKLDGQDHHGFVSEQKNSFGLRIYNGTDPVPSAANTEGFNFSLGDGEGIQHYGPERAAGTAFIEIRRKDEKGLQLSRLDEHSMETAIRKGLAGWTWIADPENEGAYVRAEEKSVLANPIWIAVNVVLRARGLFDGTAEEQEESFDVASAVRSAAICDIEVKKLVGTGMEKQFTFTGILAEPKPTRDWLQEILNNCLGYYTTPFGKIKFGIRVNSSAVEQFSDGNIIFGTLDYEPIKPSFWHISGNFADEEFGYVGNAVEIYDEVTHEKKGGVPTKSHMNFLGASSKSQVARLVTTRLREELGGWQESVQKVARRGSFRTTLLGLSIEPGTVCRIDHEDLPDMPATAEGSPDPEAERPNHIQLRVQRWRLNKDYSIDVEWRSTHNEVYELLSGPKPADVELIALPREETFKPADWRFSARTDRDGLLRLHRISVRQHKETVHRGTFEIYYCHESENFYGTVLGTIDAQDTEFTMSGHPPMDGRWIMVDSELMYVERYAPTEPNFGDVTVRRGELGTRAAAHSRIDCTVEWLNPDNPCHMRVEKNKNLRPGSRVVVNDGGGPPYSQQPIASYDNETGDLFTTLPLATVDEGDPLYSDPRLWIIDIKTEEVNFQPRFFSSANRSNWEHVIDLRNAGVALIRGRLHNTRGIRSDAVHAFPSSADQMDPVAPETMELAAFRTEFPHRIRTHDGHTFQMPYRDLPLGSSANAFQTVKPSEAQPFDVAYAEVTGGVADAIATPPVVSALVPTELRPIGKITLQESVDEYSQIEVRIEGDNEMRIPVWVAADWEDMETLEQAAEALRDWLNGGDAFAAYFTAAAEGPVVTITSKGPAGGTIVTATAGSIKAVAEGLKSKLGILTGRKYAVAYHAEDGDYLSELSPLSASTGPTGAAERVEVKDIPISSDERVGNVWLYAAPDGKDEPLYKITSIANGTDHAIDEVNEADLKGLEAYPGSRQPEMDGPIIITLKRNGEEWSRLFIPKDKARSNDVHGFALDPIEQGAAITVDVDNQAETLDLTVNLL